MRPRARSSLVGLLVGIILLSYPLINMPNRATLVFGIPALYLYVFALWIAGVALAWILSRGAE